MGSCTTFAQLIAAPESEKVFLAEIEAGERIQNWAKTGGYTNVYEKSFLNEAVTLADSSTETIRKVVATLEEDGTALTSQSSINDVDSNAGSFYHDTANSKLYCHTIGSDDPDDYVMVGLFWLYVGTKGVILNDTYYEPLIAEKGIPSLSRSNPDIYWGVSQISSGKLVLLNGRGWFDQISRNFLWVGKKIKLLLGGDALPYSEYYTVFTGLISEKSFTRNAFTLILKSNAFHLFRSLPINNYWTSDYANLDPMAEGRPIPYYYGEYNSNHAPLATCIDTGYDTNTYQFKLCDHAIGSITQVYINYQDGDGWQTISHSNENLTDATFTIVSTSYVVGISQVKVAFTGKQDGGSTIESGAAIVEDLLTAYCGYSSVDLSSSHFTDSKDNAEFTLNVPIENVTSVNTIIDGICKSELAFFDEDGDGLLRYRLWDPIVSSSLSTLDEHDFLGDGPEFKDDTAQLFANVRLGYGRRCAEGAYTYKEESSNESGYKYGRSDKLTHNTYLRTAAHAAILAKRLRMITETVSPSLTGTIKIQLTGSDLGDTVPVTLTRAPSSAAGGIANRPYEIYSMALSFFPSRMTIKMRDVADLVSGVGFWMAATAPAYTAATQAEIEQSGFWCDADGLAEIGNDASANVSKWW